MRNIWYLAFYIYVVSYILNICIYNLKSVRYLVSLLHVTVRLSLLSSCYTIRWCALALSDGVY